MAEKRYKVIKNFEGVIKVDNPLGSSLLFNKKTRFITEFEFLNFTKELRAYEDLGWLQIMHEDEEPEEVEIPTSVPEKITFEPEEEAEVEDTIITSEEEEAVSEEAVSEEPEVEEPEEEVKVPEVAPTKRKRKTPPKKKAKKKAAPKKPAAKRTRKKAPKGK